jgi:hypothetical protein
MKVHVARAVMQRLPGFERRFLSEAGAYVGQYVLDTGERHINIAIDAHDNRKIASGAILDWSDVYFKSNKWVSEKYPAKVMPLVNGNGLHTTRSLAFLKSLRETPKEYDFVFISRFGAGIEHNLKLFKSLARLKCRKHLVAILYADQGHDAYVDELEAAGITCVRRNLETVELWKILARTRINFLRLGAKYCVPWRMIDLLCLGSCIVIDRHPFADWPVPLRNLVNFVSCFARTSQPDAAGDYECVLNTVERLLAEPEAVRDIANNNAAYFDRFAAPAPVAAHIVQTSVTTNVDPQDVTWSDAVAPWVPRWRDTPE